MITIGGNTYPLTYVGDCDIDFSDPIPGSSLTVETEGELDTVTRSYRVQLDRKNAVQAQLGRLKKQDFEFKGLVLRNWSYTEDGPSVTFNVTFRGLYDNKLPRPKISGTMNPGSVVATLSGGFLQSKIDYLAPSVTWRYVTRGIPRGPAYAGEMPSKEDVVYRTGSGGAGKISVTEIEQDLPPGFTLPAIAGTYNIRKRIKRTAFTWDTIGPYCQVVETNSVIIEPFEFSQNFQPNNG